MGIEVVLDQPHIFNSWVVLRKQVLHKVRIVDRGTLLPYFHIPEPSMRLEGQQHTAGPILLIFIMVALGFSRTHGQDGTHLTNKKTGPFIKTDQWAQWIIRQSILEEHIFHMPKITPRYLPNAPLFH